MEVRQWFHCCACKFPLRNDRQQRLRARQEAQQYLETVLNDQKIENLPVCFQHILNFGMLHDVLTKVKMKYLQKFADRRIVERE